MSRNANNIGFEHTEFHPFVSILTNRKELPSISFTRTYNCSPTNCLKSSQPLSRPIFIIRSISYSHLEIFSSSRLDSKIKDIFKFRYIFKLSGRRIFSKEKVFISSAMDRKNRNRNRKPRPPRLGDGLAAASGETVAENQLKLGSLIPFYGLSEGAGSASRK